MSQRAPAARRSRRKPFIAAALTAATMVLASLGIAQASAAPDVPAGVYTGPIGQSTERTVTFPVSNGHIGEIDAQTYMYCSGWPVAMYWGENPEIPIADDGSFDAEYWFTYDDPTSDTRFRISGSITSDGVATGELKVHLPNLPNCAEGTEPFTATLETPFYEPEVSVSPSSLTQSELASQGVDVTGVDFPASSSVSITIDGIDAGSASTDANGAFAASASASLDPGTYTLTATSGSASASTSLTVDADPEPASIEVSPTSLTVSELEADGVSVSGVNFPPSSTVTIDIGGTDAGQASTDTSGAFSTTVTASVAAGSHTITASSGSISANESITVTEDPAEPEIVVTPGTLTASELADGGLTVEGVDFPASSDVTISIDGDTVGTTTSDNDGAFSTGVSATLAPGTYTVTASSGSATATGSVTVTEDPTEPELSVSPDNLTVDEMAEDGITVSGTGFPGDSDVTISIDDVEAGTATTDSDGAFTQLVTASIEAGEYTVTAESDGVTASATIEVEPNAVPPVVAVQPEEVTVDELLTEGVTVSGTNFPEQSDVVITIDDIEAGTATTDTNGTFSQTVTAQVSPGSHTVTATSGDVSSTATLEVIADNWSPEVQLDPTELTQSELADSGVSISATGFRPDTELEITFDGELWHTLTTDGEGAAAVTLTRADVEPGEHEVAFLQNWISGGGWLVAAQSLDTAVTITVTADEPAPADPEIELETDTVTTSELADGIQLSGSGFGSGEELSIAFEGTEIDAATADDEGSFTETIAIDNVEPGEYTITVTGESGTVSVSITVIEDDPEPAEPTIELEKSTVTSDELADGIQLSGSGFAADEELTITFDDDFVGTTTSDDTGAFTGTLSAENVAAGEYVVTVSGESGSASVTLTVSEDPEPTDPEPTDPEPTDPEPTDPDPTAPEPTTDPEPTDRDSDDSDKLPQTGFDGATVALLGLAALAMFGGALLAGARRFNAG
ncbi:MAG TPA: LPXTG cell wall anchor domain-containing protein [Candidatus Agrococcus pullicola]|uniref:LPXTG cell wall anchor domain-containing protein n=1 Tax=Candidatus Agrococcus pullicola TaxID=2838429 RepID=A0A9D2C9E8_9MICO|nr:LPXTG cell wall anchor domain-containing protein [Candidatus Agrococcus pullicola]